MNGSDPKYTAEYVEIKTSLENIRTKIENLESVMREVHRFTMQLSSEVNKNRSDIAGIKATAALIGGMAGCLFAALSRWFFLSKS